MWLGREEGTREGTGLTRTASDLLLAARHHRDQVATNQHLVRGYVRGCGMWCRRRHGVAWGMARRSRRAQAAALQSTGYVWSHACSTIPTLLAWTYHRTWNEPATSPVPACCTSNRPQRRASRTGTGACRGRVCWQPARLGAMLGVHCCQQLRANGGTQSCSNPIMRQPSRVCRRLATARATVV